MDAGAAAAADWRRAQNREAQRRRRAAASQEERDAAQALDTAAHRAARAAAPQEQRAAEQARNTEAHRAARAAAPQEQRAAAQARDTAAHRAARAPHGELRRAASADMPTDAYLNAFDSDPMAANALHFALMYHWKGEAFRDLDFSQLGVNPALDDRLLALLAMMDEEGLPDAVDVKRCMAAYVQRVDPKQPVRGCGSCGEADVPAPLAGAREPPAHQRLACSCWSQRGRRRRRRLYCGTSV